MEDALKLSNETGTQRLDNRVVLVYDSKEVGFPSVLAYQNGWQEPTHVRSTERVRDHV